MADAQFLLLSVADGLKIGGTVRVVGSADSESEASSKLAALDASILGRIAIVEVKELFERRPAVQNVPSDAPILKGDR